MKASKTLEGKRLPRRECKDCDGSGFRPVENGYVVKCHCWRYVKFTKAVPVEVHDGKMAATGE
jgi:hypothetical protein